MRGATGQKPTNFQIQTVFQSTLPMRGATSSSRQVGIKPKISIHTPHAGSDFIIIRIAPDVFIFQSTLPMRGATCLRLRSPALKAFQSTLPMRGATVT